MNNLVLLEIGRNDLLRNIMNNLVLLEIGHNDLLRNIMNNLVLLEIGRNDSIRSCYRIKGHLTTYLSTAVTMTTYFVNSGNL